MKQTITYIKNGVETTTKVNALNKNYLLPKLFRIHTSDVIVINHDISLIYFKNINFTANKIKCENLRTICIFENCTFKQSTSKTFEIGWGSFELINPNFIDIDEIRSEYLQDFILTITDKNINEQTEISLDISAFNINIEGNFLFKKIRLGGVDIVLGNDKTSSNIKILPYSFYSSIVTATDNLTLNNCLIENISKKPLIISSPTINMDDDSSIKTNRDVTINGIIHKSSTYNQHTITKKDILRMNLIYALKNSSKVLKTKIDNLTNKYVEKELFELNQQIEIQEKNLNELKEKLSKEQIIKNKAITKSLTKKSISYLSK